ncbi:flavodoxin family protein [Sporolituus thermophilus]|uniref:Multimeric flavodoxin WrbA n=1 Tax=Sporolituus thermophilus DSM 23256 TaxID=1123285 RepID=A0A1G7IN43_9FIRM|nr:flavodoxin family protein [Sporolituus thermophilus]SDF13954.1 Multimeric flavodoxin WrbA [Sporolituus thermophilus DSM 23256]
MKVLGIIGSPRKNGNTAALVTAVCKGAAAAGHQTEVINITGLNIHDCVACCTCKTTKGEYCAIKDDMQTLYPKIVEADCLVLGTPVYMGQMTGQMKNFFDRWYTFMDADYQIRYLPGKKYITVTASGAPAEVFQSLSDYLNHWLGNFFKMELVKNIVGGGLGPADAINSQPELLAMAENTGRSLK